MRGPQGPGCAAGARPGARALSGLSQPFAAGRRPSLGKNWPLSPERPGRLGASPRGRHYAFRSGRLTAGAAAPQREGDRARR